jgi:competence protein ComEC
MSVGFLIVLGHPRARRLGVAAITASALVVILHASPPAHWNLTVLDVGHGDAILLEGPRGETALIDAGGDRRDRSRARDRARRSVLPALARRGVDHLDLLVLTHGDLDHAGGAHEVARRIPVSQLWTSACPQRRLVQEVARSVILGGGEVIRVSSARPIPWGDATLQVLWPEEGAPCAPSENDRSIVLRLASPGGSALLMGDAGEAVEARLLATDPRGLESDVLKVGHHGSKSASTAAFLGAVRATMALVSAPARHRRSLPSQTTLRRLREGGLETWITGRDGGLSVDFRPGASPRIEALRSP